MRLIVNPHIPLQLPHKSNITNHKIATSYQKEIQTGIKNHNTTSTRSTSHTMAEPTQVPAQEAKPERKRKYFVPLGLSSPNIHPISHKY